LLTALLAGVLAAAGCRNGDDSRPTAEPSPSATAAVSPAATTSPGPTQDSGPTRPSGTPPAATLVPSRVHVIDVRTGRVTTLYDSAEKAAFGAQFDGNVVEIAADGGIYRFNLDGTPAATRSNAPVCTVPQGGVEIGGRKYPDVPRCGVLSPDVRWMMYERPADEVTLPNGARLPSWDQWVLDVQSGATRELQKGLVHCGGCDARYGPRWSPTSQYVAYAEYGGDGRRFLSRPDTGETRAIGTGNEVDDAPIWAPTGNRIFYSTVRNGDIARLEDFDTGNVTDLPVRWPVRFDDSGTYLYSPAWDDDANATDDVTTIIDAHTFAQVAQLDGSPPRWLSWVAGKPVGESAAGYVAALQAAAGCDGTSIAVAGAGRPACIAGGIEGTVSPVGALVAVATVEGSIGPVYGPGFQAAAMRRCAIVLFDTNARDERRVLGDVPCWDYGSPLVAWNEPGTHLLVLSPRTVGL